MTEKLNIAAAAKALGISSQRLRDWAADGMPYEAGEQEHQNRYQLGQILQWHIDRGGQGHIDEQQMSKAEAQRRSAVARALSDELDLAEQRGQLVRIDDLMAEFGTALAEVRAAITAQANRLTGLIAHQDEDTVNEILTKDAGEILNKLSKYRHSYGKNNEHT